MDPNEKAVYLTFDDGPIPEVTPWVLDLLDTLSLDPNQGCYLVGPEKFMEIAARKLIARGIREDRLYLSMEKLTLCGIGMCGECACGDRLTCRWGTFMRYDYLALNAPEMVGL